MQRTKLTTVWDLLIVVSGEAIANLISRAFHQWCKNC